MASNELYASTVPERVARANAIRRNTDKFTTDTKNTKCGLILKNLADSARTQNDSVHDVIYQAAKDLRKQVLDCIVSEELFKVLGDGIKDCIQREVSALLQDRLNDQSGQSPTTNIFGPSIIPNVTDNQNVDASNRDSFLQVSPLEQSLMSRVDEAINKSVNDIEDELKSNGDSIKKFLTNSVKHIHFKLQTIFMNGEQGLLDKMQELHAAIVEQDVRSLTNNTDQIPQAPSAQTAYPKHIWDELLASRGNAFPWKPDNQISAVASHTQTTASVVPVAQGASVASEALGKTAPVQPRHAETSSDVVLAPSDPAAAVIAALNAASTSGITQPDNTSHGSQPAFPPLCRPATAHFPSASNQPQTTKHSANFMQAVRLPGDSRGPTRDGTSGGGRGTRGYHPSNDGLLYTGASKVTTSRQPVSSSTTTAKTAHTSKRDSGHNTHRGTPTVSHPLARRPSPAAEPQQRASQQRATSSTAVRKPVETPRLYDETDNEGSSPVARPSGYRSPSVDGFSNPAETAKTRRRRDEDLNYAECLAPPSPTSSLATHFSAAEYDPDRIVSSPRDEIIPVFSPTRSKQAHNKHQQSYSAQPQQPAAFVAEASGSQHEGSSRRGQENLDRRVSSAEPHVANRTFGDGGSSSFESRYVYTRDEVSPSRRPTRPPVPHWSFGSGNSHKTPASTSSQHGRFGSANYVAEPRKSVVNRSSAAHDGPEPASQKSVAPTSQPRQESGASYATRSEQSVARQFSTDDRPAQPHFLDDHELEDYTMDMGNQQFAHHGFNGFRTSGSAYKSSSKVGKKILVPRRGASHAHSRLSPSQGDDDLTESLRVRVSSFDTEQGNERQPYDMDFSENTFDAPVFENSGNDIAADEGFTVPSPSVECLKTGLFVDQRVTFPAPTQPGNARLQARNHFRLDVEDPFHTALSQGTEDSQGSAAARVRRVAGFLLQDDDEDYIAPDVYDQPTVNYTLIDGTRVNDIPVDDVLEDYVESDDNGPSQTESSFDRSPSINNTASLKKPNISIVDAPANAIDLTDDTVDLNNDIIDLTNEDIHEESTIIVKKPETPPRIFRTFRFHPGDNQPSDPDAASQSPVMESTIEIISPIATILDRKRWSTVVSKKRAHSISPSKLGGNNIKIHNDLLNDDRRSRSGGTPMFRDSRPAPPTPPAPVYKKLRKYVEDILGGADLFGSFATLEEKMKKAEEKAKVKAKEEEEKREAESGGKKGKRGGGGRGSRGGRGGGAMGMGMGRGRGGTRV